MMMDTFLICWPFYVAICICTGFERLYWVDMHLFFYKVWICVCLCVCACVCSCKSMRERDGWYEG